MQIQVGVQCTVETGIDWYTPPPWFTLCVTAIAHHNHYFHQYHENVTPGNKKLFCDSCNHSKRVLKDARSNYDETTCHVASQLIRSCDFWRICNSILNRGKSIIPPLFNGPEVLKICNSTVDDGSQQLPDFLSCTEQRLSSKNITYKMDSCAIYDIDASKATDPDRIPAHVFSRALLFLLSYTINAWPNLVFLPVGNLHWLFQFLEMMERDLIQVSIVL